MKRKDCVAVIVLNDGLSYSTELRFSGTVAYEDKRAVRRYKKAFARQLVKYRDINNDFPDIPWAEGCGRCQS